LSRRAKVATQLGNQGQAEQEARLVCEFIWGGAIGPVREVNVWSGPRFWPTPAWEGRPPETPPVPEGLDWDLWLGPAPQRPYHPAYHPWSWRNWWDFGTGLLGDLGCHKLSTVFKALKLGHPTTVEACSTKMNPEIYPLGVIARYEFPARGDMPPVTLNWYDGGLKPPTPKELEPGRGLEDVTYVGEKGVLMGHRLIPESRQRSYGRPAQLLPRSPGHHKEFVDACRGGQPAGSNFVDHAGLLSEVCLLGNVALRAGKKLTWDGPSLKVTSPVDANRYLAHLLQCTDLMQAMINDVLAYARVDTQAKPFAPVDFAEVVTKAMANLRAAVDESGAELSWERLPVLAADGAQMIQLFQNLIGNAIKFRRAKPQVRIFAVEEAKRCTFAVADNGIGIAQEHLERIFGMFQRLHTAAEDPGTGIGLAICKRIVERHGGRIWAVSEPGQGSTFCFTIPKTLGPATWAAAPEPRG
jgi:two-component sensor histidine kinase